MSEPTEKQIQASVIAHWRACRLPNTLVAAIPNARAFGQPGLTKGLPDLLVISPKIGVGFLELKRNRRARKSIEQIAFANLCDACGVAFEWAFGRDEPITVLTGWGAIRS